MSNSLGDLLGKREYKEPPEVGIIKAFVAEKFKTTPSVTLRDTTIIITVPGAALAGALRPHLHVLQQQIEGERRLVIRIGH